MKRLSLFLLFLGFIAGYSLISCRNKQGKPAAQSEDTLKLKRLDTAMIQDINDTLSPEVFFEDTTGEKLLGGKGKLWKLWQKLHKNCQNSEITKGMIYFGVSNTLGLGTIVQYDKGNKKYIPDFPMLPEKFTDEQKKLVFNVGAKAACQFEQQTKVNSEFLAKSNMSNTANGELSGMISNSRSIDAKIDSWQQNILFPSGLNGVLSSDTNSYFKQYLATSKKENRYIVNKEILIHGFSAIIHTTSKIQGQLKADLEKGITEKIGDTEAQVKFSYVNETTIKVTTLGSFVVFVELYKLEQ